MGEAGWFGIFPDRQLIQAVDSRTSLEALVAAEPTIGLSFLRGNDCCRSRTGDFDIRISFFRVLDFFPNASPRQTSKACLVPLQPFLSRRDVTILSEYFPT